MEQSANLCLLFCIVFVFAFVEMTKFRHYGGTKVGAQVVPVGSRPIAHGPSIRCSACSTTSIGPSSSNSDSNSSNTAGHGQ